MNIFTHSSINYLVIVDYFSDYFEFEKLNDMSSAALIEICKRCFARLGIPETVHSDNGPQFFPHVNLLSSAMSVTSSTQPARRITPSRMGKPTQVSNWRRDS